MPKSVVVLLMLSLSLIEFFRKYKSDVSMCHSLQEILTYFTNKFLPHHKSLFTPNER